MKKSAKKYFLLVLGCQMNQADAERINRLLGDSGWQRCQDEISADLIVVVACAVRQAAVDRVRGKAQLWQKRRQAGRLMAVLTSCVLDQDKKKLSKYFDSILGIAEIRRLPEILGGAKASGASDYLCLPALHSSDFSALVPISNGCNNFCSYCAVPYTRGREKHRPADDIIKECRGLIGRGYKEIILLGQNVNSYRSPARHSRAVNNPAFDFARLLQKIDKIPGDYRLKFMTSHPKDLSVGLIKVMANGRHLAPQLHLALQSGDDEILKAMNRKYTAKKFLALINRVRRAVPGIAISTDIIVGFPGETRKQFLNTAKLMRQCRFDMAYLAQYSPRPQTAAAKIKDDVPKAEKKRREEELNDILKQTALANNRLYLGRTEAVLVDGYKAGKCYGRSSSGKIVAFSGPKKLIGQAVKVKITSVRSFSLAGEKVSG
ncbi:MAG: tRNA (N6-isopentenyl adenosine(37)-C2)-methylthiotransferase MiaB [Candidatus Buchananbacteria bacterium]